MSDLSQISTADLVAELERRRQAEQATSKPPEVYFFGVWPGSRAGHYLRSPGGGHLPANQRRLIESRLTGGGRTWYLYPWDPTDSRLGRQEQVQGLFHYWQAGEITVISCWDRTEDPRGNCCSAFVVLQAMTGPELLALARQQHPKMFARIEGAGVEIGWAP
jgi:hypothetical protein